MITVEVIDPLELAWLECNDTGNARRLAVLARGLLKWVDDKYWAAFDGRRWSEREGAFRARMFAHEVAQHLNAEAAALGELIAEDNPARALKERFGDWCTEELAQDRLAALRKWAVNSGNARQTDNMLRQARDLPEMRAWPEEFDTDPLAFNLENGTLWFRRKGEPLPPGAKVVERFQSKADGTAQTWVVAFRAGHEPSEYFRQLAGVAFDPKAVCPMWEERLVLLQPEADQRAVLPILYGQCLTGLTDGEEFYTHQGEGRDGKSKTHDVLAQVFGDYYRHVAVKTWLAASFQKSGSEHRRDLVDLAGDYRFLVSEEPTRGSMWDSELLKQWTGGNWITAYGSGAQKSTVFKPNGKINVEVNKLPAPPSDDRGWWDRQTVVPWPVYVPGLPGGAEPPAQLIARLLTERAGILNWLIGGCLDWLELRKVPRSARMTAAVISARSGSSPIEEWLAEECDRTDKTHREGATVLYNAFKAWCERNAVEKVPSQKSFGTGLNDRQIYVEKDGRGNKVRVGVRLRGRDPLLEGGDGEGPAASASERSAKPTGHGDPGPAPGWDDLSDDDPLGGW